MKRFLPILFFTGLLVGQDTLITISGQLVATFSDPKKQFEFEKKKIYLNDKESVLFSMERNGMKMGMKKNVINTHPKDLSKK